MARVPAEQRIYAVLKATTAITDIVSDRIYPVAAKQAAAWPQLVFRRVSTTRVNSLSGDSGLEMARIQIDCMAETYLAAKALASEVLDAMDAATSFKSDNDNQVDQYDSDPLIYIVSLDFMVYSGED